MLPDAIKVFKNQSVESKIDVHLYFNYDLKEGSKKPRQLAYICVIKLRTFEILFSCFSKVAIISLVD